MLMPIGSIYIESIEPQYNVLDAGSFSRTKLGLTVIFPLSTSALYVQESRQKASI